mmetsp:Transcript_26783/g.36514  ORF Transcript_26783/g.36514 Transcript_26783/m.36514 type:complete len:119 (-) Transcript_26783:38-394(-)
MLSDDIQTFIFGNDDIDSEEEEGKGGVNIENMSSEELTNYYREMGLKKMEDMDETEKLIAQKKLQDFIDQKNNVNKARTTGGMNTQLKAGGLRKRGFGGAIANKNRYANANRARNSGE